MEPLKHECGVAMIRLLKPLEYYREKYGTWMYGGGGTGLCEAGSQSR